MSTVTLETLRVELQSFATVLLRNELRQFKDEILADLPASQPQQLDKIRHSEDIASPVSHILPDPPARYRSSPLLQEADQHRKDSCCGYEPTLNFADEDDDDDDDDGLRLSPPPDLNWARRIAENSHFKHAIIGSILCSLVTFVVQTDYAARHWTPNPPIIFHMLELVFLAIFMFEIILRICGGRLGFFCGPHHLTNIFDLVLVLFQGAEMILETVHLTIGANFIGALRMLRLSRVLRIGRLLHLVPAMRMLFVSILSSFDSLLWILLLVILTTGSFAVLITQAVTDHKIALGRENIEEHQHELEEYFGSVGMSTFKLYQTISDGCHWADLAEPLMRYISPWTACILIVYSAFVTFALMNVVTAFFVETALVEAQEDLQKHMSSILWESFHEADANHSREITEQEFMGSLNDPAMVAYLKKLELSPEKARDMRFFSLIDKDGSGAVNFNELTHGCLRLMGNAKAVDIAALLREFREEISINQKHRHNTNEHLEWVRSKIQRTLVTI